MGVRVTPDLDTLNTIMIANQPKKETYPDVVFNGDNYVVVWNDMNIGGDTTNFYTVTSRVTPGGVVLDTPIVLSSPLGPSDSNTGRIGFDGVRCLVVWRNSAGTVYGRFVDSQGQPSGSAFLILASGGSKPDVAFDGENYFVIWYTSGYDVVGQFVSPQGQLVGNQVMVAIGSDQQIFSRVSYDGQNYLVVWRQPQSVNYVICGQFVSPSGTLIGSNFVISEMTTTQKRYPVAAPSDQNYLVAWDEARSGVVTDIYGNVDVNIMTVQEQRTDIYSNETFPSIYRGTCELFSRPGNVVYDAKGCRVESGARITPGVYFILKNDQQEGGTVVRKVLVVD